MVDVLKLNLLQNDAERIKARVTNPRQPLWLSKTRTSKGDKGFEFQDKAYKERAPRTTKSSLNNGNNL